MVKFKKILCGFLALVFSTPLLAFSELNIMQPATYKIEWFPWVRSILAQQPGFISICHNIKGLCANISLQFEDSTTFEAWLAHPRLDCLVDALDDYRDRNYWEAARTDDEQAVPSQLQWTEIKPRKNGLNPKEKEFGEVWESTRSRSGKSLQELTF